MIQTPSANEFDPSKVFKDLGVLISDDCSWKPQIKGMVNAAFLIASLVLSVFNNRSEVGMLTLCKTMVRSKVE